MHLLVTGANSQRGVKGTYNIYLNKVESEENMNIMWTRGCTALASSFFPTSQLRPHQCP